MRDVRTKRLQRSEQLSSGKGSDRQRIQKLRALELLPAHAEDEFDEFVALAASLTGCQFAFFTLVTEDVVWVKSSYHAETQRFSRRSSFCTHTIEQNDIFLVPDALEDPHFSQTSLHIDGAQVRFYVGIPIKAADGITIGTLCALDREPKQLDTKAIRGMFMLGNMLERRLRERERAMKEITGTFKSLRITGELTPPESFHAHSKKEPHLFGRTGQRSALSHQTRNIFACIQCNCEYLLDRFQEDEDASEVMVDIKHAVNDLAHLIDAADQSVGRGAIPEVDFSSLEDDFDSVPLTESTLAEPTEPHEISHDSEPEMLSYDHLRALRARTSDS